MGLPELKPGVTSARSVKAFYDQRYQDLIDSGEYVPFLYPWATVGAAVVLVYLLIDHRRSRILQALRFPLFGFLCAFSAWSILNHKARSAAAAYGVGLVQSWGTLWTGAIIFFNDCQTDFKRIERADAHETNTASKNASNGSATRIHENGMIKTGSSSTGGVSRKPGSLIWQSYPESFSIKRLDWIADVFCSFRGVGWSFETNGIPPLPDYAELELHGNNKLARPSTSNETMTISRTGIRRFTDRTALLKDTIIRLTLGAMALDTIKCLMHHDAYFWGYMDAPPPAWLFPHLQPLPPSLSPTILKSYRLLLSLFGIHFSLHQIFRLGPLLFVEILGPSKILGLRSEPWMNPPDAFGALFSPIFDQGLSGWWGNFWHQMFRFSFEAPSTRVREIFKIPKRSEKGKILGLGIAFFFSGFLHACGSFTQLGNTRPGLGPFMFFQWQTVGVVGQMFVAKKLKNAGVTDQMPKGIRQMTNFLVTIVWMYWTAPLLVDDFAKGGVWLYEPLAFSPLRALGFGAADDRCWDLWHGLIFWHQGEHWWNSGLAF
ncbi:uncharacterized protein MYCFIDRAFT_29490 [Pseudocercospora fijiensis CIRAD86]|uniref:Wax synthase domain-containing protein n=1 Tax=Pseudocercospora fijiensis (strain CIRAD86) TaxID=383855 RepID=M3AXA2_PSEFD|nr:uncharacterized protein MYCFIDRAFT_29490 [Pseudocercospora fijiensis CIRAD86]EME82102.1 hypothetical protein MYCFIDRAFT_29490 [Pseudocercospora fijiensis CIRAD86]